MLAVAADEHPVTLLRLELLEMLTLLGLTGSPELVALLESLVVPEPPAPCSFTG
jgi:hypothetical protein